MELPILNVSQLNRLLKDIVEPSFENLVVEGELSGVKPHTSGHLYFTLKDQASQVDGALFYYKKARLSFVPKDGDLVQIRGKLSVYETKGRFSLIAASMTPVGLGVVLAQLEERKRRLQAEGIFDPELKRPLPAFPGRIVLITSATGAAVQDMLKIFRQKGAWVKILIIPAAVQGDDAPAQIISALRYVNLWKLGDVIIIGRGGGSMEDLMAFSDEGVVRAIAESEIPTVSAVGHEIDHPLSDLAADANAPTPTAAASLVWPHVRDEWKHRILENQTALADTIQRRLEQTAVLLRPYRRDTWIQEAEHLMDPLRNRLLATLENLQSSAVQRLAVSKSELRRLGEVLEAHSPLGILERGYAVVSSEDGSVLTDPKAVPHDTLIHIRLAKGRMDAVTIKEKT